MKRRKHKHNAKPVRLPTGEYFHSTGEYHRWLELQLLEKGGAIRNLERQIRVPLLSHSGVKIATAVIDFGYFEGERRIWEDHKSAHTRGFSSWKRNLRHIKADYPNVEIREHTKGK
ncbi:MAG: hypothetical protein INF12_14725 [Methylobacterium sp.]|nr:hypothetical protein [Methylobacterium sp.]